MKNNSYMDRALRSRDPRYATILGRLGYARRDMQAVLVTPKVDELDTVRDEYQRVLGKRPFHGWDVATLKMKIAEAKG